MDIAALRLQIESRTVDFNTFIDAIDAEYEFTPTAFVNGDQRNAAGETNGSCKLFSFAKLHGFSKKDTLACFGRYYFEDVLKHRDGTDHQNIRNFMKHGWSGIRFSGEALKPRGGERPGTTK